MFRIIPVKSSGRNLIRFTLNSLNKTSVANASAVAHHGNNSVVPRSEAYPRIGSREIVGFGRNGEPQYFDANDLPCPGIRWAEDSAELKALREKAKGDWASLSLDEKRALYRADFRMTFAEMNAPSGEWKFTTGAVLALMGLSVWIYYFVTRSSNFFYVLS
jgi:hypothetical protein